MIGAHYVPKGGSLGDGGFAMQLIEFDLGIRGFRMSREELERREELKRRAKSIALPDGRAKRRWDDRRINDLLSFLEANNVPNQPRAVLYKLAAEKFRCSEASVQGILGNLKRTGTACQ